MFITELKNNQAAVTGIAQLNDPTSELSRALVSMGWKPPSTAAQ